MAESKWCGKVVYLMEARKEKERERERERERENKGHVPSELSSISSPFHHFPISHEIMTPITGLIH
jgi:hypothetical protein